MPSSSARARHRNPVPRIGFRATSAAPRHSRGPTARDFAVLRRHLPAAATITAAMVVGATITAANAGTDPDRPVVTAASGTAAAEVPAQASAGAAISFDRSPVTTVPAPKASEALPSGSAGPEQPSSAAAVSVSSSLLGAPLASMSVSSPFGFRTSPITGGSGELHTGLDLVASCQTAVFAAGAGTVVEAGWSAYGGGNRIVVDHGKGLKSTYNHLASIETGVGAAVAAGQRLAAAGTTGNSTGCHLHFEVLFNGQTVNPQGWM
ncbi:peptidoglycan DD-metalloendopeptidase family protein [Pseudarthrobacter sp. H3Y2-7]|uniref:M23 family metallopeptidase n=1 Tax=Pseudarthrobacter naphthalenicus TaxID=3031328 RepID=UPI0023AF2049|nr:peptidoglycan DD-metalloendopeptidase family protein [Pseudarthrobacter sp. H3Y2-7]MDE8669983.1 peptidoglycan DD-metalloendopeptidase family protein [Pseudarthrobacter sp. H3Y2-7]